MPDDILIEALIERMQRDLDGTPVILDFKHTDRVNVITLFWWARLPDGTVLDCYLDANFNQLDVNPVELIEHNLKALAQQAKMSLRIHALRSAEPQHVGVLAQKAESRYK